MLKFPGFVLIAALLILAGCATPPAEPPPREWSIHEVSGKPATPTSSIKPAVPDARQVRPTPQIVRPAPVLTWTSLNRWAAENKLAPPRKVPGTPVASYAVNSAQGTVTLVIGSREAIWRGMDLHLGFPPEIIDDQVFIHGLDLQKNLEPLLLGKPAGWGTNRVLVLDPGHGGANVGTRSVKDGRFEKEFTLDWAWRIKQLLATNGWTVLLTRTNDAEVSLSNRVAFAEMNRADVFISLHFNSAAPDTKQSGMETYCLTPPGMPSTITRGFSDNWTDRFPNNAFDVENIQLAVRLHSALLRYSGEEDRGIRRARFMGVLQGQRRPAVLLEAGYLSNAQEAAKIENAEFRQKLAEAVAEVLR